MKTDLFHSCGYCWVFQICWHIECSTFTASCFRIWNSSTGIPSPPLSLFVVMLPKAHLTSHSRMSGIMITMTMKKNNSVIRRSLLRFPWAARRSNQSVLKAINPEYSLEGLMLKLKLQYVGHLMWRTDSLEKTLILGKIEGKRGREQQRMRWLHGITNSVDMNLGKLQETVRNRETCELQSTEMQRVRHDLATEQQQQQ